MSRLPPPDLKQIFKFLKLHPDQIFVFTDRKAAITWDEDHDYLAYLYGPFGGMINGSQEAYVTYVAKMAMEAQLN